MATLRHGREAPGPCRHALGERPCRPRRRSMSAPRATVEAMDSGDGSGAATRAGRRSARCRRAAASTASGVVVGAPGTRQDHDARRAGRGAGRSGRRPRRAPRAHAVAADRDGAARPARARRRARDVGSARPVGRVVRLPARAGDRGRRRRRAAAAADRRRRGPAHPGPARGRRRGRSRRASAAGRTGSGRRSARRRASAPRCARSSPSARRSGIEPERAARARRAARDPACGSRWRRSSRSTCRCAPACAARIGMPRAWSARPSGSLRTAAPGAEVARPDQGDPRR